MMDQEIKAPWRANVLTLFEEMFPGPLEHSLAGQGIKDGRWTLETLDIRRFSSDKHCTVDDAPFGGGAGMVLRADVIDAAIKRIQISSPESPLIYLSPRGVPIDQRRVKELAMGPGLTLICGRYEGIDERLLEAYEIEELSIGDFILSGGEPAAIALIDSCVRLLPGIMGSFLSAYEESFDEDLLEYPHYTRPQIWRGKGVPEILLSGHHERIKNWRRARAKELTRERRPDLWVRYLERNRD